LNERYNDYVMVALRTVKGIDLKLIESNFGVEFKNYCTKNSTQFIEMNKLKYNEHLLSLTKEGIHISNLIIGELMYV